MPKVRRVDLPEAVLRHLLLRVRQREVSAAALESLAYWLDGNPEVPEGDWFHRLPEITVCGRDELVLTLLKPGQVAIGEEV